MSVRQKVGNFLFDIDNKVEKEVEERLQAKLTYRVPGEDKAKTELLAFRQQEFRLWAMSSPLKLIEFYGTFRQIPGERGSDIRQLFWEYIADIPNYPKMHFPAPESLINHMKSLLWTDELKISFETGNQDLNNEIADRFDLLAHDLDFYEMLQSATVQETYSGTIAAKFIMDTEVNEFPIVMIYPAERIRFRSKYNKVQEIIFEDYYNHKNKTYTLNSIYGKGYIKYQLVNEKNKEVPLNTIKQTEDLKDIVFVDSDGKPLPVLMACWKKNRSQSNEFPDEIYGGSDFEGITDIFHQIDEIYSNKANYIRRTQPILTISEDMLPYNEDTKKTYLPKEYSQTTIKLRPSINANNRETKLHRDVPEINLAVYDEAILNEMKHIYQKIGMAYTSVGLETHSANISGAALETKEKSTLIVRANKIKLWEKFLKDFIKLLFIYDSLANKDITIQTQDEDSTKFTISKLFDAEINIEFPAYNDQTFEEKAEALIKALNGNVIDIETAVRKLYGDDLSEEQIKIMVRNIKIENGIAIIAGQMVDNDGEEIEQEIDRPQELLQDLIPEEENNE